MNIEILGGHGGFASALVQLEAGEQFVSESGAMYRCSANVDVDVTTRSRGKGGLLSGLKRLLASEKFFFSSYRADGGRPGEVGLAPTHQGQVQVVPVRPDVSWYCSGGSYLGSSIELGVDTEFQGLKGLLSGESLSYLKVSGQGDLLVGAFGRIVPIDVEDELVVDTGHLVAFESTLEYSISKASRSWMQSFLSGEGFVMRFRGRGRCLVQSHNPTDLGKLVGPMLPPRS
jgi:uncharacterized protein (TIGR00266 family)